MKIGRPSKALDKAIAAVQDTQEIRQLNIKMSKSLHIKLKQASINSNMTMTELTIQAIKKYIDKEIKK